MGAGDGGRAFCGSVQPTTVFRASAERVSKEASAVNDGAPVL
jgi:hypothetical protein